jgi:hypothetical protein
MSIADERPATGMAKIMVNLSLAACDLPIEHNVGFPKPRHIVFGSPVLFWAGLPFVARGK